MSFCISVFMTYDLVKQGPVNSWIPDPNKVFVARQNNTRTVWFTGNIWVTTHHLRNTRLKDSMLINCIYPETVGSSCRQSWEIIRNSNTFAQQVLIVWLPSPCQYCNTVCLNKAFIISFIRSHAARLTCHLSCAVTCVAVRTSSAGKGQGATT